MSYIAAEDIAKAKEMDLLTYLRIWMCRRVLTATLWAMRF